MCEHMSSVVTPVSGASQFDAVVVGAGVVGLSAAIMLARRGLKLALIAPMATPFVASPAQVFDPRVFALSNKSQRFFADIRAWDAMPETRVTPVSAMEVFGDDSKAEPLRMKAADVGLSALTWIVEQQSLLDALETAARFTPGLTRIHAKVNSQQRTDAVWHIDHEEGTAVTPWLFAADGANSLVRAAVELDFPVEDYNAEGVVGTFRLARPHNNVARQWFLGSSILALLPLPDNCVSMVWSMDTHQYYAWQRRSPAEWVAALATVADGCVEEFSEVAESSGAVMSYPLRHGVAPLWFADGVVLLGDAAHQVHPLAGQGLNLGIEDVVDLQSGLDANANRLDDAMLRKWQRQRKAECQPVHWMTHGLNGLFRVELPGVQWLRNTGLQLVDRLPGLKRWLITQAMR